MTALLETIEKLHKGECFLQYRKLDGSLKTTTGTTEFKLIPEAARPKDSVSVVTFTRNDAIQKQPELISYFDTSISAWRSFYADRLERIIELS